MRRNIRGRYITSVMGLSWAIIQPLALLVLYTFAFSYVRVSVHRDHQDRTGMIIQIGVA